MFRNREIRQFAVLFLLIALAVSAAGFAIAPAAGVLTAAASIVQGTLFFVFTWKRYRDIACLSEQIDRILHNVDRIDFSALREGELSILESEISRMILRIREQNQALRSEKKHLADSLADIAHQLRTPLTAANLTLSLLKGETDPEEQRALVRETEALFRQMEWLLNSLLKLSRLDAGIVFFRKDEVRVDRLIESASRPLLIAMELRGISLRTEIPEDMRIIGDAGWLSEALQNILKNCLQNCDNPGEIQVVCEHNLLYGEIAVRDSGPGLAREDLAHLFERFYRGKDTSAAGYGIGLALCREIIVRQGGTVTAGNHPQGGAVFRVRFPSIHHSKAGFCTAPSAAE